VTPVPTGSGPLLLSPFADWSPGPDSRPGLQPEHITVK
jgi:hypothetical protein